MTAAVARVDVAACDASPALLRIMIRQNEDALRGLLSMPPRDVDSPSGQRHVMTIGELREQTRRLNERLDFFTKNPPLPRKRKSWRDIPPPSASA